MMMGMQMQQRMILECTVCGGNAGNAEEHLKMDCPRAKIQQVVEDASNHALKCNACHEGYTVHVNTDDYLECAKCNTRYTTAAVFELDESKREYLLGADAATYAYRLPSKGEGKLKWKRTVRELRRQERVAKRRKTS